ncbi:Cell division protein FtsN [Zhongshania aliphaticivorans]|uniref:Cell division protein FtsN n=1 Tax=Zhongshania aliphaticivorans TaxID=1470434 RepID=A0A5S9N9C7_9GAMM|nr:SPOR domain-containing protein [Zhongshania aliphaticivorans]CAA0079357.1 Cell division protein FtsN [Zhongshania aliphaticivorans]CAA0086231.1 Cell division protein FtsN [Zhongshania aliphaticivorans]
MATQKKTTRGATRSPARSGFPGFALFGSGFAGGIICSVLVYSTIISTQPEREKLAETKAAAAKEKALQDKKNVSSNTKFDFFTVLPEREVIVTDEQRPKPKPQTPVKTVNKPPVIKEDISDERYILQAGSFRQGEDADRRRAQILILGLDAKVESVEANGDRWHRVYVGPFQSHNTLTDARTKLINESIDTLVIRQKK